MRGFCAKCPARKGSALISQQAEQTFFKLARKADKIGFPRSLSRNIDFPLKIVFYYVNFLRRYFH